MRFLSLYNVGNILYYVNMMTRGFIENRNLELEDGQLMVNRGC